MHWQPLGSPVGVAGLLCLNTRWYGIFVTFFCLMLSLLSYIKKIVNKICFLLILYLYIFDVCIKSYSAFQIYVL